MAGLGRKVFTAGEVLTAANVQGYLMDQSVMVFAGTAARSSAIATATEGMLTYLSDTNALEAFDGSNWGGVLGGETVSTATAYTVTSADAGRSIRFTASSAVAVTVSTATAFVAGQRVDIFRDGAGTVTISAGTGTTVYGRGTAATNYAIGTQYDAVSLYGAGSNSYRVIGNATAS